jgi:hypothetical protein
LDDDNPLPQNDDFGVGGLKEKCTFLKEDLGHIVEQSSQIHGKEMADIELYEKFKLENPRILNPNDYANDDDFINALENWYIKRIGKKSTFIKRKNLIKTMIKHPIFPIDIRKLNPDQIDAQFEYDKQHYNKDTARKGKDAIINKVKALKMVARATNQDIKNWNLIIPAKGKPKHKIVPLPEIVYKIVHSKYSNDPYENALYGHLGLQGFIIGPRISNEFSILKLKDLHIEEGYIHFYQPKVDEWRMSTIEHEVMNMSTRKSYKNLIDHWRPTVENQYSKDFVYLQPNGKPFTEAYLRKKLNDNFKQIYPQYHPYCMRDWSAIARMVTSKFETGSFDIQSVSDFFNHSDISVTQSYTLDSDRYYKMKPINWIKAVLKSNNEFIGKENSLNRKTLKNDRFQLKSLLKRGINPHRSAYYFY